MFAVILSIDLERETAKCRIEWPQGRTKLNRRDDRTTFREVVTVTGTREQLERMKVGERRVVRYAFGGPHNWRFDQ